MNNSFIRATVLAAGLIFTGNAANAQVVCSSGEYRNIVIDWKLLAQKPDLDMAHRVIKDECLQATGPSTTTRVTIYGLDKVFTSTTDAQTYLDKMKEVIYKITPEELTKMKVYFDEARKRAAGG